MLFPLVADQTLYFGLTTRGNNADNGVAPLMFQQKKIVGGALQQNPVSRIFHYETVYWNTGWLTRRGRVR